MRIFLKDKVILKKWKNLGSGKQRVTSTATVDGSLQQIDSDNAEKIQGVFGRDYMLYILSSLLDDLNVIPKEGDQIEIKDSSDIYVIKTIEEFSFGSQEHYQIVVSRITKK